MSSSRTLVVHPVNPFGKNAGGVETSLLEYFAYSANDYVFAYPADPGEARPNLGGPVTAVEVPIKSRSLLGFLGRLCLARLGSPVSEAISAVSTIHVHNFMAAPLVKFIFPRKKLVVFLHNDFRRGLQRERGLVRHLKRGAYELLEWLLLKLASQLVDFSANQKLRMNPKVVKAEIWFDPAIFRNRMESINRAGIIWAGRLEPVKDPLLAVRAFRELCEKTDTHLTMIGGGSLRVLVEREIWMAGLHSRITLRGWQDPEVLAKSLSQSKVLLLTSWSETGPKVALEALAMDVSVVATQGSDPTGIVSNTGWTVQSRSASELADALMDALNGPLVRTFDRVSHRAANIAVPRLERELTEQTSML